MRDRIEALLEDIYRTIESLEMDMAESEFGGTPFMKGQWCAYRNIAEHLQSIKEEENG